MTPGPAPSLDELVGRTREAFDRDCSDECPLCFRQRTQILRDFLAYADSQARPADPLDLNKIRDAHEVPDLSDEDYALSRGTYFGNGAA